MQGDQKQRDMEPGDLEIDQRLRAAILAEPMDTTALDARIRERLGLASRGPIRRGKWIAAAGIAAILAIAVGGYVLLPNRGSAVMCSDAARDHRIEVVESGRRNWLMDAASIDALAAKRGLPGTGAEAIAPPGYRLERGKLCRLGGRVFLHLVYSDGAHEFSFYLRDSVPSETFLGTPRAMAGLDLNAEHVAQVESPRFTALVVTNESRDAARDIAHFTSRQLAQRL
jgi:hypothetical protein